MRFALKRNNLASIYSIKLVFIETHNCFEFINKSICVYINSLSDWQAGQPARSSQFYTVKQFSPHLEAQRKGASLTKLDNSKTTAESDKSTNSKGALQPAEAQVGDSKRSGTPRPQPSTEKSTAPPNTPKTGVPVTSHTMTPQQTAGSDFT